jgi:hypothetical protein
LNKSRSAVILTTLFLGMLALNSVGAWAQPEAVNAPAASATAAPESKAATPAAAPFQKGPLPPLVAEQIRTIVMAQVKAFLPPIEEGSVVIARIDKDTLLTVTLDGQKYSAKVFRSFLVEPLDSGERDAKEYCVRTMEPWKLKANVVIPADIYLSKTIDRVCAYDADMIAAQDAAVVRSEVLSKSAIDQLEQIRRKNWTEIVKAQEDQMAQVTARITQRTSEISKKQEQRKDVTAQVEKLQTPALMCGKDPDGKVIWDWNGTKLTFYDNLEQDIQSLATARVEQKTIERRINAQRSAVVSPAIVAGAKRAIQTVLSKHRKRVLAGDAVGEDEMRQDYEAALGPALKIAAAATPEASQTPGAAEAPPAR